MKKASDITIGFSTGALYKYLPRVAELNADYFYSLGANAIEFTCSEEGLDELLESVDLIKFDEFEYISIHAPKIMLKDRGELLISKLEEINKKIRLDNITFHPDEVDDFSIFSKSNLPFSVENMDKNKSTGKTVESLKKIFDKYDFGFVLDVNHCFTNDPSGELLKSMIENFGHRLRQIHLSGYKVLHDPIVMTKQNFLIESIKELGKPIIIESVFDKSDGQDLERAREEIKLVKKILSTGELVKK